MALDWTTPKTDWANNNLVAADDLNTIGKNLAFLKAPPTAVKQVLNETSNFTTTSSAWVDVDAGGDGNELELSLETAGGDILIGFGGWLAQASAGYNGFLDIDIGGTRVSGANEGILSFVYGVNYYYFTALARNIQAGTHIIKLVWRVPTSTATLHVTGIYKSGLHFWAREVS